MTDLIDILAKIKAGPLFGPTLPPEAYTPINLSKENPELQGVELGDPKACQGYIDKVLNWNKATIAYGGYLEQRNLYSGNAAFETGEERRDVHLGVDYWTKAGTKVLTPLDGEIHSFKNNAVKGDYGPTIILKHTEDGFIFYSLYGHLSLESLTGLYVGKQFKKGEVLASLGTPEENVNYAPHLHFQLILNLHGKQGDYLGVCRKSEVQFYKNNCPDPNLLFSL
ncbi:peptidoglycan DD-metalloendopeptidase family protein [Muriicola soli]|uniref:peptidoglycan DD-metalloendopeptidase family protein n=1 Tax=Muriicola soli TaxID=2507538 RepID=UPI0013EDE8A4|nr:peptidoglycan DD-metalloendopeptidase family protein [Muriicola soli]